MLLFATWFLGYFFSCFVCAKIWKSMESCIWIFIRLVICLHTLHRSISAEHLCSKSIKFDHKIKTKLKKNTPFPWLQRTTQQRRNEIWNESHVRSQNARIVLSLKFKLNYNFRIDFKWDAFENKMPRFICWDVGKLCTLVCVCVYKWKAASSQDEREKWLEPIKRSHAINLNIKLV